MGVPVLFHQAADGHGLLCEWTWRLDVKWQQAYADEPDPR